MNSNHVRQKKVVGGIVIPQGPPPTLVEAAQNALLAIAAWKLTDDQQPYKEIGPDLRGAFRKAHDELLDALPKWHVGWSHDEPPDGFGIIEPTTEDYCRELSRPFEELASRHLRESASKLPLETEGCSRSDKADALPLPLQFADCPRSKWYATEGKRLRAEGWRLRKVGAKWNLTHALIERQQ